MADFSLFNFRWYKWPIGWSAVGVYFLAGLIADAMYFPLMWIAEQAEQRLSDIIDWASK